jgi:hypothetical protein
MLWTARATRALRGKAQDRPSVPEQRAGMSVSEWLAAAQAGAHKSLLSEVRPLHYFFSFNYFIIFYVH